MRISREKWKLKNPNYKRNRDPEKVKQYKSSDPLYKRKFQLQKVYGMSWEEYQELYNNQKGECPICLGFLELIHPDTVVDHCHNTGKIRGLLCRKCNMALGLFSDNIKNLNRATKYLGE